MFLKSRDLIDELIIEAQKSDVKMKHSAAIFQKKGKRVLNIGFNHYINTYTYAMHAEQNAASVKNQDFKGLVDIVIIRINKKNQLRYSRPCNKCIEYLKRLDYKIENVYYSTNKGDIICEELKNMEKLHNSKSYKKVS